jgi:hypothetical protein
MKSSRKETGSGSRQCRIIVPDHDENKATARVPKYEPAGLSSLGRLFDAPLRGF